MADSSPKLGERILQARHAAKKASQNIANQLSSSSESEGERKGPPRKRSAAKMPRGKLKTPDLKKKPSKALRSAIVHSKSSPVASSSAPKGKKRKVSEPPSPRPDDDDSDATSSLSSFPPSPALPRSTQSLHSRRKLTSGNLEARTPIKSTPQSDRSNEKWNLIDCASFVFVLVDASGEAVDEGYEGSGALMWWPGKVRVQTTL
jgi:hypothetical protein